jgi:hypothetical protein
VDEQFQVVDVGIVAHPLELDHVILAQVAPQRLERRRGALLPSHDEEVAAPRQLADGDLRLHVVIVPQQQLQQLREQRVPLRLRHLPRPSL